MILATRFTFIEKKMYFHPKMAWPLAQVQRKSFLNLAIQASWSYYTSPNVIQLVQKTFDEQNWFPGSSVIWFPQET